MIRKVCQWKKKKSLFIPLKSLKPPHRNHQSHRKCQLMLITMMMMKVGRNRKMSQLQQILKLQLKAKVKKNKTMMEVSEPFKTLVIRNKKGRLQTAQLKD